MNNQNNRCGSCDNCIADILKVILILQQNADQADSCLDSCDRGFLGQQCCPAFYNTRPIQLYLCGTGSEAVSMPISKNPNETVTSSVFRLEKLDECCATFRVLVANDSAENKSCGYTATNSFFTCNLDCLCMIRCLDDTFVENV